MSCVKSAAAGGEVDFPLRFRVQEGFRTPCPLLSAISWFPLPPPSRSSFVERQARDRPRERGLKMGEREIRAPWSGSVPADYKRGAAGRGAAHFLRRFRVQLQNGETRQTMPLATFSVKRRVSSLSVD